MKPSKDVTQALKSLPYGLILIEVSFKGKFRVK